MPRFPFHFFASRAIATMAALLCNGAVCAAPTADYALREWHTRDGLPSEEITRITPDAAGFLWLATAGGLVRFDGTQFLPVHKPGQAPQSMPSFTALAFSSRHGVLVAPYEGGVAAYDKGVCRLLVSAEEIADQRIFALFVESPDAFWVALEDGTLLRHADGHITRFDPLGGSRSRDVPSFSIDRDRRLWITRGSTLTRFLDGKLTTLELSFGNSPLRATAARKGGLWIVTRDRVHQFDGTQLDAGIPLPPRVGARFIQDMREDARGGLCIATRSAGVHRVFAGMVTPLRTSHEDVSSLVEDEEGNLWLGTNGGGLNRLRERSSRVYDTSIGLAANYSYAVCEDADGAIWLANRDGGVAKIVDETVDVLARRLGWPPFAALSVVPDRRGGIWIASGFGLYRVHGDGRLESRKRRTAPEPLVRVMFAARNGDIWFADEPDRVGRIRAGEQFEYFDARTGFAGRQVRCVGEDRDGTIWIGTADGRLYRFDGARFHAVELPPAASSVPIQTAWCDPDGILWFGTAGNGLLARRVDGSWQRLDLSHGLAADNITQILADNHGFLWFGTSRGIFRAGRRDLVAALEEPSRLVHATAMGLDSGLTDISCSGHYQPAAWKASDGRLWFTTRQGTLAVDPTPLPAERAAPPVTIETVRRGGQILPAGSPVELAADGPALEIGFSVLSLSTPERVRVMYRLEGYDDDWTIDRDRRTARYSRLPAGSYLFRVQATGAGGGSAGSAQLRVRVHPRWWQTGWARGATLLVFVAGVTASARAWSHRRLRRRLQQVEREHAIERERTRIAQNIHDDLGASLTRISLLTQTARRDDSGSSAQLDEIHQTASEITRALDEIVWAVNPKNDELESFADYLGNFAQSFLNVAGIRCRLTMPAIFPPTPLTSDVRHSLFLCCKEALNNVVKHAQATEVVVSLSVDAAQLSISIRDNGRGLTPLDRPAQPDRAAAGNGLAHLQRRLAAMNGTCSFHPAQDGGTVILFSLPIHRIA